MNGIPIVMVRNEERFIGAVLRSAVAGFGTAIVGDTGSTDRTVEIARAVEGVYVVEMGPQTPAQLGQVRHQLAQIAGSMGAEWGIIIDGDVLYRPEALRFIAGQEMPAGKMSGFSTLVSVEQADDGKWWEMADRSSQHSVFPVSSRWSGSYPFESPDSYGNTGGYHYFGLPPGYTDEVHCIHLHRAKRSERDGEVFMRQQKQNLYSMMPKPNIGRVRPLPEVWVKLIEGQGA